MTPLQSALFNLEAARANAAAPNPTIQTARISAIRNGRIYAEMGGAEWEVTALSNGAVAVGTVVLLQIAGGRAVFHSMPR